MQIFHFTAPQDEAAGFEGVVVAAPNLETAWLLVVGVSDFAWLTSARVRGMGVISVEGSDGLVLASRHGSWVTGVNHGRNSRVQLRASLSG